MNTQGTTSTELTLQNITTQFNASLDSRLPDVIKQIVALVNTHTEKVVEEKIDAKIDEFALMVGRQFNAIDDQFKEVWRRFDRIDARLDKVSGTGTKLTEYFKGFKTILQHA